MPIETFQCKLVSLRGETYVEFLTTTWSVQSAVPLNEQFRAILPQVPPNFPGLGMCPSSAIDTLFELEAPSSHVRKMSTTWDMFMSSGVGIACKFQGQSEFRGSECPKR